VKITALEVDHTPVKPAFGFRIDYSGRSVVLSGDTRCFLIDGFEGLTPRRRSLESNSLFVVSAWFSSPAAPCSRLPCQNL
jgi:hypothetical protein